MSTTSLGLDRDRPEGDPAFRLDVGSVLRRTFQVWAANLGPFSVVGLVAYSPVLLLIGLLAAAGSLNPLAERVVDLLTNLFTLILTGAVTYGVFRHLHAERAGAGEILRMGLSRFGAVWVTGIMMGIAVLLGFCALVIPGIVLLVRYWVAVPVAVIESPGATASLQRSSELTEGNRWRIFAVAVLMLLVTFFSMIVLGLAVGALAGAFGGSETAEVAGAATPALTLALLTLVLIPVQCLTAVAPVIAYHDLRVGKEGVDVEDLLRVFE
jgi:hypothetical protein